MTEIHELKCEACDANAPQVPEEKYNEYLLTTPGWDIVKADGIPKLGRIFKFNNFREALDFTNKVGETAEAEGHHPALLTEWGQVTVLWWTHKLNGLHINDFIMAAKVGKIYSEL